MLAVTAAQSKLETFGSFFETIYGENWPRILASEQIGVENSGEGSAAGSNSGL